VWFAPFPPELTTAELIELFRDCADRAEYLRCQGARVVLVTGCELTLFNPGLMPGANSYDRIARLGTPSPRLYASFARLPKRLNAFLAETAGSVRGRFGGPLTYAAGTWLRPGVDAAGGDGRGYQDLGWRPRLAFETMAKLEAGLQRPATGPARQCGAVTRSQLDRIRPVP
jgi:hypothetical protein